MRPWTGVSYPSSPDVRRRSHAGRSDRLLGIASGREHRPADYGPGRHPAGAGPLVRSGAGVVEHAICTCPRDRTDARDRSGRGNCWGGPAGRAVGVAEGGVEGGAEAGCEDDGGCGCGGAGFAVGLCDRYGDEGDHGDGPLEREYDGDVAGVEQGRDSVAEVGSGDRGASGVAGDDECAE